MSETKNDFEQVPEELDNQVDTAGDETSPESITSLFQRLRIPFVVSVVDESGDKGQVVSVGNRQYPIGSANIEYHGLFVTADEHAVLESGNPSNTAWIMGFMIDPHLGANIREKYRDLEYPVPVIMDGKQFMYYRNFPIQETRV